MSRSLRTVFAYGAALAMAPYLIIKISWVAGILSGLLPRQERMSVAGAVALNTVTIGMAAAGITLALALVRPWGERIPAFVVLSCAWIGCGFLVPMIPYAVVDSLTSAEAPVLPAWEYSLIQVSFLGMGVGLAVALPFYLRARWPAAFAGRTGDVPATGIRRAATWIALAVGVVHLYWAAGGTVGLRHPGAREPAWFLQAGNTAFWSLAGAWGVWAVARNRPALPLWMPVGVCWLVSGFLAAWGGWKFPFAVLQAAGVEVGAVWPEHPVVAAGLFLLSVVAGAAMLGCVLRVCRARHSVSGVMPGDDRR